MLKIKVLKFLARSNAFAPIRFLNRHKVPILMYHRFSRDEEFGKTSWATFESHLSYLTRHYKIISLDELIEYRRKGEPVPPRSAAITIDDGYRDFYDIAFPVLKKFNVPATLYVVTGFVDGKSWIWTDKARYILGQTSAERCDLMVGSKKIELGLSYVESRLKAAGSMNAELKKMLGDEKDSILLDIASQMEVTVPDLPTDEFKAIGWGEAREMQETDIEIGSHTANHPILTNMDEVSLADELRVSKLMLEDKLQKQTVHFCYPNGNVSKRERDAAEKTGYESAVTTELRLCENGDDPFLLSRIDAESEMHRFVQATSGFDQIKR
ncbi:MAG: polysaccharide deacetylase family protein [Pyrinomonadaceae bacterium]